LPEEHVLELHHAGVGEQQRGSLPGTSELEGTIWCPRSRKNFRNSARSSALVGRLPVVIQASNVMSGVMSGASVPLARFLAKGGPELLGIEAAILKEARLLCTLAQAARRGRPELAPADFPGQLHPVDLARRSASSTWCPQFPAAAGRPGCAPDPGRAWQW
jgi:hypothetical protein